MLEVLVAFSLLAITLAVILQSWAGTLRGAARTEQRLAALSLAESLLAGSGRERLLETGETSGRSSAMDWTLSVIPAGRSEPLDEPPSRLYMVTAEVAWEDGAEPRAVSLTSLRMQPVPAPRPARGAARLRSALRAVALAAGLAVLAAPTIWHLVVCRAASAPAEIAPRAPEMSAEAVPSAAAPRASTGSSA